MSQTTSAVVPGGGSGRRPRPRPGPTTSWRVPRRRASSCSGTPPGDWWPRPMITTTWGARSSAPLDPPRDDHVARVPALEHPGRAALADLVAVGGPDAAARSPGPAPDRPGAPSEAAPGSSPAAAEAVTADPAGRRRGPDRCRRRAARSAAPARRAASTSRSRASPGRSSRAADRPRPGPRRSGPPPRAPPAASPGTISNASAGRPPAASSASRIRAWIAWCWGLS